MPDVWGLATLASTFALYLGCLAATGAVFVAVILSHQVLRGGTTCFAILAIFGALMRFASAGAVLAGSAAGIVDPDILGLLWSTTAGPTLGVQVLGLALVMVGVWLGGFGIWIAQFGAVLALCAFANLGHIGGHGALWLQACLLLHVIVAAFWIGVLAPLYRLAGENPSAAAALGHRFGRVAAVLVPALVLAGVAMANTIVGGPAALFGSSYGQVLLVKIGVVGGLLGIAARNKTRLIPAMQAGAHGAASALRRAILWEWAAFGAILLVTATLSTAVTPPH